MGRLRRVADGLLEAGWLATVVLVPLFLDKNRVEVFDTAKAGLLRALALVMLAAWAIKALSSPGEGAPAHAEPAAKAWLARLARAPLAIAAALWLLTTLLSTALSLTPYESVWGHFGRGQGALTVLAMIAVFAATAANLRPGAQVRRLVTALLLPTVPIAVYAILQRLHLEPLQITARQTEIQRATSLLGQPVFLAAYLGMLMPFTVHRLVTAARDRSAPRALRMLSLALYGALILLQLAAALVTESRGPLLGIGVAAAVGLLSIAARRGARRTVLAAATLAGAAVLTVALATPIVLRSAPQGSESYRIAQRVSEFFDPRGGGGLFRAVNWTAAERVITSREPMLLSDGTRDEHAGLRTWVGYGPELQYGVATPFYPPDLPFLYGYFLMDRFHNDLWDALITTGVFGLLTFLGVQTTAFYQAMRALGHLTTPRRRRVFWGAQGGGAALGALIWTLWQGSPFALLGLQVGAVTGMALFLAGLATWGKQGESAPVPHEGVITAILMAFAGHAIETSFSFTVATTATVYWVYCAVLVVYAARSGATDEAEQDARAVALDEAAHGSLWSRGLLLGLVMMALGWAFLGGFSLSSKPGIVLWEALTLLSNPAWKRFPAVSILAAVSLVVGTVMLVLEPDAERRIGGRARPWRLGAGIFAVATSVGVIYWARLAFLLAQRGFRASSDAVIVARNVRLRSEALTSFHLWALLLLVLLAFALTRRGALPAATSAPRSPWLWARWAAAPAITYAALALVSPCALKPAFADAAVSVGTTLENNNQMPLAEEAFRRAIDLQPGNDRYVARLSKAYAKHARLDASKAAPYFQLANQAVLNAIALNPASGEHASNLAIIRGQWALAVQGPARDQLRDEVTPLYQRALAINPQDPTLWRRWGQAQLALLDNPLSALASAQRVVERDPKNGASYALLADCQMVLARSQKGQARKEGFLTAASSYRRAINLTPRVPDFRVGEGKAYLEAGEAAKAVAALRSALQAMPAAAPARTSTVAELKKAESVLALVSTRGPSGP